MTGDTKNTLKTEDLEKAVGGAWVPGTGGDDALNGTMDADSIQAGDGNDFVCALGGDDHVDAGAGNDIVHGGSGNDAIFGGSGNDHLDGGEGADFITGEGGNDVMTGGAGDRAADVAFGGEGNDSFAWAPGSGNDQFHGEAGRDTLQIGDMSKADVLSGLSVDGQTNFQRHESYDPHTNTTTITFTSGGQPVSFSGSVNHGGETVQFFGIESITVQGR